MADRSAIPGLKRLPKPDGFSTWYWAASQVSRKSDGFEPKTARLWHGRGGPSAAELASIERQANTLTSDLREWLTGRRKRKVRARRGFIYFVRAGARVKIGFTTHVPRRVSQLQTFFPEPLDILLVMEGSILDERELHRRFAAHQLGREWFNYAAPLTAFVARASGTQGVRCQNRGLSESLGRSESLPGGACNV